MSDVARPTHLTPRQPQIARLVSQGFSNKEIDRRLDLSEGTVKAHLRSVYTRLRLRDRTELASWLREAEAKLAF
jgi:DNA-binding NarL/FixJ family response regulator